VILCPDCGVVPMDESELPLLLPDVENYEPT
jgi:leucyl-tRNA synthetase